MTEFYFGVSCLFNYDNGAGQFLLSRFSLGQMKCFTEYLKKGKAMASISVD